MRIQFWREEKEEERSSLLFLLIPIALLGALFWLLPRLKEEEQETGQDQEGRLRQPRQQYISAQQGQQAVQESREEEERQSSLQRQHMRQDQVQQEPPQADRQGPGEDRQQKEMKQPQAKERGQGKNEGGKSSDKLEEIEGIGPKTAQVLRGHGITTFRQLADTPIERLNEIMEEAGFRINPPDTWPEQARFAADGDWEGLKSLKERLKAGRPQ